MYLIFGMSGGEIIVILLVFLIFFGSKKIPDFARVIGKTLRQMRDISQEIKDDITSSAKDIKEDITNSTKEIQKDIQTEKKKLDQ